MAGAISLAIMATIIFLLSRVLFCCWISPFLTYKKLRRNGFGGPTPSFPLGNLSEMKRKNITAMFGSSSQVTHNIHSVVFPYFARWKTAYGKVYTYWLGTEPFLYTADPELLKILSAEVKAKNWGKPSVFKHDRKSMFGNGLVMAEGDEWVRQRHVITPAFHPSSLKAMGSLMVECTTQMLDRWADLINSGNPEIEAEKEITATAGEIIAKTSFGINHQSGRLVFEKLIALQMTLFKTNRLVGVPFAKFLNPAKAQEAKRLGKEIDSLFLPVISTRREAISEQKSQHDLLSLLLKENGEEGKSERRLTTTELIDECKTFFFGGHETTALAVTWSLLLLAIHTEWQNQLREEIRQLLGDKQSCWKNPSH